MEAENSHRHWAAQCSDGEKICPPTAERFALLCLKDPHSLYLLNFPTPQTHHSHCWKWDTNINYHVCRRVVNIQGNSLSHQVSSSVRRWDSSTSWWWRWEGKQPDFRWNCNTLNTWAEWQNEYKSSTKHIWCWFPLQVKPATLLSSIWHLSQTHTLILFRPYILYRPGQKYCRKLETFLQ